ncbi:MerR family transcriptional regulator [Arthrobacter livingstonensis]|uniref:MerR family transcriptional regulator n=1 Tax=Arthrobacter livingstonensis TaxID=670078 RepID=A0A2V5LFU2_9MICC|nr:MerR family transcriptional regulator [Arthrobacter livingstonensis]PYI69684.1 MerR family transcriptional regulator [Arthrobacter livingstonensis]
MFQIGDFARVGRVSVRMLRHYESIGLLHPARVDSTGYRFYEGPQLARLNRIVALKNLGFTLETVSRILDSSLGVEELRGMLLLRRSELEEQLAADSARLTSVEARLHVIESEGTMPEYEVIIKPVPAVRLAELSAEAESFEPQSISPVIQPLYEKLYGALAAAGITPTGPGVAYYDELDGGRVRVHAGAQIPSSEGSGAFDVVELPAVEQAATLIHRGVMDNVMPSVQALARWIDANGWVSTGPNRELYLDYGMGADPEQWITELQEPVARA